MAEFVPVDRNKYKIIGVLNEEDIAKINSFKNRTTLILENTAGLSSKLISGISSDRIVFSIKGGLDYDTKEKYKDKKYVDRTFVSPSGLCKIIKYFEYNEALINPSWNEFEKAMFMYNALVVDMDYDYDYEDIILQGTVERSLNGILYGKLVCAGFAQVYKEMLDRIGIKNYYQNQKDVHAFNIIEIAGKKYGVDVTWDNNDKKNYGGKCVFGNFGHDVNFYTSNGHHLYSEIDDFEKNTSLKNYDADEEVYDLSVLSMDKLNEYYSHIAATVNKRGKLKQYNIQEQPIEVRNKYLPVDMVDFRLRTAADNEYPIITIIDFLEKRGLLQVDPELIMAFRSRYGYLLDIGKNNIHSLDLSTIGINNYEIDRIGSIIFKKNEESRYSRIFGVGINSNMSQAEINMICVNLNKYLKQYFNKYILNIIHDLDSLLSNYEYEPNEWDTNRAIESSNIYTKLSLIVNCRNYLIKSGMDVQAVDNIIAKIKSKYYLIHKPYENGDVKKQHDLDFLSVLFANASIIKQTMEYDLKKQISEDEFISLYSDADYMIGLFERYIMVGGNERFKFSDYNVTKEELKRLLDKMIENYQKQNELSNLFMDSEIQNTGFKK